MRFVTGSDRKFREVRMVLPDVERLDIDLPEIQETDPHAVIRAKLEAAFAHSEGEFIVEDTGLYLECLNGFPGPLIKWLLKAVGYKGIVSLTERLGNDRVSAKTVIGYAKGRGSVRFFEGELSGRIVPDRGKTGFGWDAIFQPDGQEKTLGEMTPEEKNGISYRKIAVTKLKEFLETRDV